jgi:hypothetical protein
MLLRKAGFFRELSHGMVDGPSLRESLRESPIENEHKVIDYLSHGVLFVATFGLASDVLDDKGALIGPPHILTDGIWAWPKDLIHYVKKYHIYLPEEFVSHMKANHWKVPPETDIALEQCEF